WSVATNQRNSVITIKGEIHSVQYRLKFRFYRPITVVYCFGLCHHRLLRTGLRNIATVLLHSSCRYRSQECGGFLNGSWGMFVTEPSCSLNVLVGTLVRFCRFMRSFLSVVNWQTPHGAPLMHKSHGARELVDKFCMVLNGHHRDAVLLIQYLYALINFQRSSRVKFG